jgi:hypothetical protein
MTQEEQIAALEAQLGYEQYIRVLREEIAQQQRANEPPPPAARTAAAEPAQPRHAWGFGEWTVLFLSILIVGALGVRLAFDRGIELPGLDRLGLSPATAAPRPPPALPHRPGGVVAPTRQEITVSPAPPADQGDYIDEVGAQQRTDADGNICAPRTGCTEPGTVSPTVAPVEEAAPVAVEDAAAPDYVPPVYTGDVATEHTNADGEICAPRSGCAKPGASGPLPWPHGRP